MNKVLELEEVSRTFSSGVFRTHTVRAVDRVSFALERGKAPERIRPLEALVAGLTAQQAKTLLLRLARQTQATGQLREMIRQLPESGEKS